MKKIIIIIFLAFAFLAGCSENSSRNSIQLTGEPLLERTWEQTEYNRIKFKTYLEMENFINERYSNFYYYLYPGKGNETTYYPSNYFIYYEENNYKGKSVIEELFVIQSEEIGIEASGYFSISMKALFCQVSQKNNKNFVLEFGKIDNENQNWNYFVNVFVDDNPLCIGTIYINSNSKFPLENEKIYLEKWILENLK